MFNPIYMEESSPCAICASCAVCAVCDAFSPGMEAATSGQSSSAIVTILLIS